MMKPPEAYPVKTRTPSAARRRSNLGEGGGYRYKEPAGPCHDKEAEEPAQGPE